MNTHPDEVAGTSFAAIMQDQAEPRKEANTEPSLLRSYLAIILRRKWTLVASVAFALLIGIIVTLLATRQYTSSVVLEITRDTNRVFEVEDQRPESYLADAAFYETQYNLLRSRALADRVIRDLNLRQSTAFAEAFGIDEPSESSDSNAPFVEASGRVRDQQSDRLRDIRATLLANVGIEPVRNSQLVRVSFTSPNPELSATIAQSWVENFIAEQIERKIGESSYARDYLEKRLNSLRTALETAERQSVEFANRAGIVAIQSETQDGKAVVGRLLVEDTVADLNRELNEAIADRVRAEAAYRQGSRTSEDGSIELTSPVLSPLRTRRAELAASYQRLLTQFEPEYPAAQSLRNEIRELDNSIAREEQRIKGSLNQGLRAAYNAATERERGLRERVKSVQQELTRTKRDNIEYNILRRDAEQNRQLYDAVLQRYMAIGVAGGVGPTNISIVDSAEPPVSPSAPSPALNMLLALALGLGLGIAVVVVQEQLDDALKEPGDLERELHLPSLGVIPREENGDYEHLMQSLRDPKSSFVEALLALRASLSFASSEGIPRSLAFTSTEPSEGKSVTCTALATRLAQGGYRTLLIDADMRSPSISKLLNIPNERGLSNALAGDADLSGLTQKTDWDNLDVMLAGPQPPSAAELLSGTRFAELLEKLGESYDKIIIDAPPVIGLADALLIASGAAGTIYIVAANQTSSGRARIALRRLGSTEANIVGAVLTKYDASMTYGYGYNYGYSYGREED
jgi:capsular exopolysaccharide synthesis family protein